MPIFNVLQINESHLARIRAHRANNILGEWDTKPEDTKQDPNRLSFLQWKRYIRKSLSSPGSSGISIRVRHVAD
jgi:hypothetical protein